MELTSTSKRKVATIALPVGYADDVLLFDNKTDSFAHAAELLTIADAAKFLKVSKSTVRRLVDERKIRFTRIRHGIRFEMPDLLAYIATMRVEAIG